MKARYKIVLIALVILGAASFFRALVGGGIVTLFAPAGRVAGAQRVLIVEEVLLMLLVAVPMLALLFFFVWRYGEKDGRHARYDAEWHGGKSQLILWAIPVALIAVLGAINWRAAFALDPYRPIPSPNPPITIDVVALTWKWLFIYPQQDIATVNFVEFPENTPMHFNLTADAPMSSFWIPQLGSQIYAMSAMVTQLNLIASTTGEYQGRDTEINGDGYAGMTFTAKSVSGADFAGWVAQVKQPSSALTLDQYDQLARPSAYSPPAYYSSVADGLFNYIVMKFMAPSSSLMAPGENGNVLQHIPAMQGMQR